MSAALDTHAIPEQAATLSGTYALVTPAELLAKVQALARQGGAVGLDIEATHKDPMLARLISVQVGGPGPVFIADLRNISESEQHDLTRAVELLMSGQLTLVGHNIRYDLRTLARTLRISLRAAKVFDTMLAEQLLRGSTWETRNGRRARISYALDAVAARYGIAVEKATRETFEDMDRRLDWLLPFTDEQLEYMRRDVTTVLALARQQQPRLEQAGLGTVFALEMGALPGITDAENRGVYLDRAGWAAYIATIELEAERARERALDYLLPTYLKHLEAVPNGHTVDSSKLLTSPEQLAVALRLIGIDVDKTDRATLEQYRDNPAVAALLDFRRLFKLASTYGQNILDKVNSSTGRIHPSYSQIGAETGRLSSSNPNWQNLPRPAGEDGIRKHVIAAPGCTLLISDFSNIEARLLAEYSQAKSLLAFFREGKDLHSETARLMFGLDEAADPKTLEIAPGVSARQAAKTINFRLLYGGGAVGLADALGTDPDTAQDLIDRYFRAFPEVEGYQERVKREALHQGYTRTSAGRIRRYDVPPEPLPSDYDDPEDYYDARAEWGRVAASIGREACNAPIQGASADMLKLAILLLNKRLPPNAWMIAFVHDEIVIETELAALDETRTIFAECMEQAANAFLRTVPHPPIEVIQSDFWAKG